MNAIRIYIWLTFLFSVLYGYGIFSKRNNMLLLIILFAGTASEVFGYILETKGISKNILYTIYFTINGTLWLGLISGIAYKNRKAVGIVLTAFLLFALINFLFIEGLICNFNTFVVGALMYITVFITHTFKLLKYEDFDFVRSNKFLLIFSPIPLLFGLSFVFCFKSEEIAHTRIWGVRLYEGIATFVNVIFYTIVNIYIYREKKLKHA